ncbi:MAG: hypothetical protein ABSA93_20095 [Streptosporangiaceae bacterium]
MAVTLVIFAALQVAMPLWIRPNLTPADRTVSVPGQPGAWLLSSGPVNAAGQATSSTPAATGASSGPRPRSTSALALALTGYFFRRLSRLS